MKVYAKHEEIQEFLKEHLNGVEVVEEPSLCNYMITGRFTSNDYHRNLRGVIIPYTGHNGIDLDEMRDKNLKLFVTPTRSRYVAEKAMTLTLSLLGNTLNYHNQLKIGNWSERNSDHRVPWVSLYGKSIGLFGFGRIGKIVHELFKPFGCDFYTIDRGKEYPIDVTAVKNVTNLVQMSDVVIVSAPLNHETEGIFSEQILCKMKHKFLINVGRGKIIDEEALYNALKNNKLRGFASDVWYNYPKAKEVTLPSTFPIYEFDNVILSNHSGGYTEDTNDEVNRDLVLLIQKISNENYEDELDLTNLI